MKPASRLFLLILANAAVLWALVANRSAANTPLLPNLAAALGVGLVVYVYVFKRRR